MNEKDGLKIKNFIQAMQFIAWNLVMMNILFCSAKFGPTAMFLTVYFCGFTVLVIRKSNFLRKYK